MRKHAIPVRRAAAGWAILLILAAALSACGTSPKGRADEFARLMPEEFGQWERDDNETTRLVSSTVSNLGHVAYTYEGPDDALAFVVIVAYPGVDSAKVARASRERELLLQELTLERDRAPQRATAQVTQTGRVRIALFQEETIVVEVDTLAAEGKDPVSDEAFAELLDVIRQVYAKIAGK